ncbi:MAG: acyltransferase [Eubacterium sp.]|nr:acyltransferase [Eubacterium sp.]
MKRIRYFDYLRVVAILAVVVLHVSGQNFRHTDIHSGDWFAMNIWESMCRWGVPIFAMISGALFLSSDYTIGRLLRKNVLRVVVAFFSWSTIYLFLTNETLDTTSVLTQLTTGYFHMWFLYMIAGMYLLVPILRHMVQNQKVTRYFLLLCFLFAYALPELVELIGVYSEMFGTLGRNMLGMLNLKYVMGFTGYFVLGYVLHQTEIDRKTTRRIYIGGAIAFLLTLVGTIVISFHDGTANTLFYENFTVNTLLESAAIFLFFKNRIVSDTTASASGEDSSSNRIIRFLSGCSFGIYLVHPAWIYVLDHYFGITTSSMTAWISVPLLTIVCFLLSLTITAILRVIPVIKRYLV